MSVSERRPSQDSPYKFHIWNLNAPVDGIIIVPTAPEEVSGKYQKRCMYLEKNANGDVPSNFQLKTFEQVSKVLPKNVTVRIPGTSATGGPDPSLSDLAMPYCIAASGILGIYTLQGGPSFLAVVTQSKLVATILGSPVYNVTDVALFPFKNPSTDMTEIERPMDQFNGKVPPTGQQGWGGYMGMSTYTRASPAEIKLRQYLSTNFYYSHDYPLSVSLQSLLHDKEHQLSGDSKAHWAPKNPWQKIDDRFDWGRHIQGQFRLQRLEGWLVPIVRGFCESQSWNIGTRTGNLVLISRQSVSRAAALEDIHGVDDQGNVSEFSESEEILIAHATTADVKGSGDTFASVRVVRGCVPCFWEQRIVRGKARPQLTRSLDAAFPAFLRHFENLWETYGNPMLMVNLLNKSGEEGLLASAYEEQANMISSPNFHYFSYDPFAASVVKTKSTWSGYFYGNTDPTATTGNYSPLYEKLEPYLLQMGIFAKDAEDYIMSLQKGCLRINCFDCCDKTNNCQTNLLKYFLQQGLAMIGVVPNESTTQLIEGIHRSLWTNNGSSLGGSSYFKGWLVDDVKRTYNNYFVDKEKQKMIDSFLGYYPPPTPGSTPPIYNLRIGSKDWMSLELEKRQAEFMEPSPLTLWMGTWNINGQTPKDNIDVGAWLGDDPKKACDMYVLGFQEIVKLTGSNVWNADTTGTQAWVDRVTNYLNNMCFPDSQWERQREAAVSPVNSPPKLNKVSNQKPTPKPIGMRYVVLRWHQLVGVVICILVRSDKLEHFREVHAEVCKTGMKGLAGNKGSIVIRFDYGASSFAFISAHFAAGQHAAEERNKHFALALETQVRDRQIMHHDYIFWLGVRPSHNVRPLLSSPTGIQAAT
eukprot:TRINITY_DN5919_c0_g1_i4.p1 TRINITY_DN5919_c0_g1~~TRINITY_DN5919_c0_g1_i4.p1  ORF type:complete len:908 (+),score=232.69 TRINITY_DN5919_c0_g1_i4:127-2724(+)